MSCRWSTEELHEKREALELELDEIRSDLRGETNDALGLAQTYDEKISERNRVIEMLDARGELQ